MATIDINAINQRIDKMGLDSWKMMKNPAEDKKPEAVNTVLGDNYQGNARDQKLNSQIGAIKNEIGANTTTAATLGTIEDNLTKIKDAIEKNRAGKIENPLNPENVAKTALETVNTTVDKTTYNNQKVAANFNTKELGLENFDVNSKDALARINAAIEKVKTAETTSNANVEKAGERLNAANERQMQYEQADKLMNETKVNIRQTPAQALLAQAGLRAESVYSLLNAM